MKPIKTILFLFLFSISSIFAQNNSLKIGYIDSDRLRREYDQVTTVFTKLTAEQEKYIRDYNKIIADLDSVKALYEREKYTMSEFRKKEVQNYISQLEKQKREYLFTKLGPNAEIYRQEDELLDPVLKKILDTIREIAVEENYDYIFDVANGEIRIVYVKNKYDLTDELLRRLMSEKTNE